MHLFNTVFLFLGAESEDNLNKLLSLSENKNNTAGQLREPSPVILLKYNNPNSPKNDPKKAGQTAVIKPSQSQNSLSSNPNVSFSLLTVFHENIKTRTQQIEHK